MTDENVISVRFLSNWALELTETSPRLRFGLCQRDLGAGFVVADRTDVEITIFGP